MQYIILKVTIIVNMIVNLLQYVKNNNAIHILFSHRNFLFTFKLEKYVLYLKAVLASSFNTQDYLIDYNVIRSYRVIIQ